MAKFSRKCRIRMRQETLRYAQTFPSTRLRNYRKAWLFLAFLSASGSQFFAKGFVCRSSNPAFSQYQSYESKHTSPCRNSMSASNSGNDEAKEIRPSNDDSSNSTSRQNSKRRLEQDGQEKFDLSKDQAISALSQPNPRSRAFSESSKPERKSNNNSRNKKSKRFEKLKKRETLLPKNRLSYNKSKANGKRPVTTRQRKQPQTTDADDDSFYSLLPPPIKDEASGLKNIKADELSDGLSSWEDFLGGGTSQKKQGFSSSSPLYRNLKDSHTRASTDKNGAGRDARKLPGKPALTDKKNLSSFDSTKKLPSIADLFPPDLSTALSKDGALSKEDNSSPVAPPPPVLDGVLPVSDLFYRSAQSMNEEDESARDDEELPFSAEQSDQIESEHNKIMIRRNKAKPTPSPNQTAKPTRRSRPPSSPRKMVRRGMEMLVGGVPINADPPQRYVDLKFQHDRASNWNEVISINSRDFGPMLHGSSVNLMSGVENGLYCEHFVHSALKWGVCPQDLKTIVKSYTSQLMNSADATTGSLEEEEIARTGDFAQSGTNTFYETSNIEDAKQITSPPKDSLDPAASEKKEESYTSIDEFETSGLGFGKLKSYKKKPVGDDGDSDLQSHLGGELIFSIGVSSEELSSADTPSETPVLERVLARGIASCIECTGVNVFFTKLVLTDLDDGTTQIDGEFTLNLKENESMSYGEMEKKAQRINSSLAQAMDDGDMQLTLASAAREEAAWPKALRDRVVEEFLFEDDDGDGPLDEDESDELVKNDFTEEMDPAETVRDERNMASKSKVSEKLIIDENENIFDSLNEMDEAKLDYDGPFGMPGSAVYHKDDIFLGEGNDGVFWNYSKENAENSPYGGRLGLRLVDAAVERMKERHPRVIAIGDVHGCIDELQDLLRQCDYRPGDLVVFLGDLVSKGPDSISVVQMAREIGAIGIRGNHDFEVIRWHQAIKSGVDPPVVGSEHFHIASCLSKSDMKWMYSLPWYISSKELGALFVHAGFVSGIRLAKQNPRLMMNMRSILPDGTVTSKFFNNWPWARLWDGPQTVLFGHDADRGLQQYEHAIGLDTGCVYGGRLTACILPEKRLVSVSARREYFKYRRKHYD